MTDNFSIARRVGRVLEARVFRLYDASDAQAYSDALARAVDQIPRATRPVLCADHRPVAIYPEPVSDRLAELFVKMNTRLERVAIVVAETNATLTLQLNRIVREANFEHRRVFHEAVDALRHLQPVLTPAEVERVRMFLAEYHRGGAG